MCGQPCRSVSGLAPFLDTKKRKTDGYDTRHVVNQGRRLQVLTGLEWNGLDMRIAHFAALLSTGAPVNSASTQSRRARKKHTGTSVEKALLLRDVATSRKRALQSSRPPQRTDHGRIVDVKWSTVPLLLSFLLLLLLLRHKLCLSTTASCFPSPFSLHHARYQVSLSPFCLSSSLCFFFSFFDPYAIVLPHPQPQDHYHLFTVLPV